MNKYTLKFSNPIIEERYINSKYKSLLDIMKIETLSTVLILLMSGINRLVISEYNGLITMMCGISFKLILLYVL